jgi:hypothetical protein
MKNIQDGHIPLLQEESHEHEICDEAVQKDIVILSQQFQARANSIQKKCRTNDRAYWKTRGQQRILRAVAGHLRATFDGLCPLPCAQGLSWVPGKIRPGRRGGKASDLSWKRLAYTTVEGRGRSGSASCNQGGDLQHRRVAYPAPGASCARIGWGTPGLSAEKTTFLITSHAVPIRPFLQNGKRLSPINRAGRESRSSLTPLIHQSLLYIPCR